jgi:hypothetical protein
VQDLFTSFIALGKAMVDMERRITTWITDGILEIIWAALTRPKKVK